MAPTPMAPTPTMDRCALDFPHAGISGDDLHEHLRALATRLGLDGEALLRESQVIHIPLGREGGTAAMLRAHRNDTSLERVLRPEMRRDLYGLLAHRAWDARGGAAQLLDIGAHIGLSALLFVALHPAARVFAFEPAAVNFFYLAWNVAANNVSASVMLRHAGLSSGGLPMAFEYSPDDSTSSTGTAYGRAFGKLPVQRRVARTLSLAELIGTCGVRNVTLVKLDCEGAFALRAAYNTGPSLAIILSLFGMLHARPPSDCVLELSDRHARASPAPARRL